MRKLKEGNFKKQCEIYNIRREFSSPHESRQDGTAERCIRTLSEPVRCALNQYPNIPKHLWGVCLQAVTEILNHLPDRNRKSAHHLVFGDPDLDFIFRLKAFGCPCHVHVHTKERLKVLLFGLT